MTCQWCYESGEIAELCSIEDHTVCKVCYDKYRKAYPRRLEGCPYCNGVREIVVNVSPEISPPRQVVVVSERPNKYAFVESIGYTMLLVLSYILACHITAALAYMWDHALGESAAFSVNYSILAAIGGYAVLAITGCACVREWAGRTEGRR